jgi:hypothetical protein
MATEIVWFGFESTNRKALPIVIRKKKLLAVNTSLI